MAPFKFAAKGFIRTFLSVGFGGSETIPVMSGPLKGWKLPKSAALDNLSMVFGQYESPVLREIFSQSKPMRVAYDVGAHIGLMTLALAQCVGRNGKVFAFEPQPDNLHYLERLIAKNNLYKVVKIMPMAIRNAIGEEPMIIWGSPSMNFLQSACHGQDIEHHPSFKVKTTTLDWLVFSDKYPVPDFLKVDVEGAEAMVLEGGLQVLKKFSPRLLIEIHGPTTANKSYSTLEGLGYGWWRLTRKGREYIRDKQLLLSLFSKDSWTHHFLVIKGDLNAF